jgi:hypothetical protein
MINFKKVESYIPLKSTTKNTILLRAFGLFKVPLLLMTSPRVIELTPQVCRLVIPYRKIVKNHLGSVYFGALAIGADAVIGMLAIDKIKRSETKVNLIFKSFKAEFLKRAEGDTIFICDKGLEIDEMLQETLASGERVNRIIPAVACVNGEEVARFELELSLKASQKRS